MCDYCSWIDQILARIRAETKIEKKKPPERVDPVIIVHGGAGKIPLKERVYMIKEVKHAALLAYNDLIKGCSAVDAVEKAISHMESKAYFNCARGGSLDVNDEVVTDAAITSGCQEVGCVGAVRDIEHPITLARKVLEKTEHVLIVDSGAQKFALDAGIPILPPGFLSAKHGSIISEYSLCEEEEEQGEEEDFTDSFTMIDHASDEDYENLVEKDWESINEESEKEVCHPLCFVPRSMDEEETCPYFVESIDSKESSVIEPVALQAGAVGAAAYDRKKRLACGTSNSGEPGKPNGSVSAIGTVLGCGVYADEYGCASVSGHDASIYFHAPARKIIRRLSHGALTNSAIVEELEMFEKSTKESCIGAVALNAQGEPAVSFKSMHFPWAFCWKGYLYYGCVKKEKFSEEIPILERPLDCMCEGADDD